jgi:hypothetical protein
MDLTSATAGQRAYRNDWRTRQTKREARANRISVRGRAVPDAAYITDILAAYH